jgi:hypothetical protein
MYRELVKPFHARLGSIAMEAGIPVDMHNCGRCEESSRIAGIRREAVEPAQVMNDLMGIKKKYGNSLVLGVAGIPRDPPAGPAPARNWCAPRFAGHRYLRAGGGFMFWGSVYGPNDDEEHKQRARWITDEYNK